MSTRWRATHAQLRATLAGLTLLLTGVALGRADLVVVAAPLVMVALAAFSGRPGSVPSVSGTEGAVAVHEGEELAVRVEAGDLPRGGLLAVLQPGQRWLDVEPARGRLVAEQDGAAVVDVGVRPTRWGRRTLGDPAVAAYDAWCAWRCGPSPLPGLKVTVLPATEPADPTAPAPHPRGLVGMERAARPGEGTEFSKVRPFEIGDRLRRIHWPTSARTGRLHVTSTYADEDAHVVVLVDAVNDVGESGGLDEGRSSMDLTVRAAAVLAEHFLRRGDRVGMRVFGAWGVSFLPSTSGRVQLRRILDTLALIEPGTARGEDALAAHQGLGSGTLALLLSPLIEPASTQQVAILSSAGIDVVVVDTLPPQLAEGGGAGAERDVLAWRLRMLQRRLQRDRMIALGIPVVTWAGPHSVDQVLRDLTRRTSVPRLARR